MAHTLVVGKACGEKKYLSKRNAGAPFLRKENEIEKAS